MRQSEQSHHGVAHRRLNGKKERPYAVVGQNGIACPCCGLPTEIREHRQITEKHLNQSYYFSRWFYCRNPHCIVTLHMAEKFKVCRASARPGQDRPPGPLPRP